MSKLKRQLPKNETSNFVVNSNLQAWQNQNPNQFFREQESTIAFLEPKNDTERNKGNITKRRDDFDLGGHKLTEINRLTCLEVVKFSTLLRTKGTVKFVFKTKKGATKTQKRVIKDTSANRQVFKQLILDYIQSVRELGNFCLECHKPLKLQSARISDSLEKETNLEKRERKMFRKSISFRRWELLDGKQKKHTVKFKTDKGLVRHKSQGETIRFADIFGCHLIIGVESNELANLYQIASFQSIKFVESKQIRIITNDVCGCVKSKKV